MSPTTVAGIWLLFLSLFLLAMVRRYHLKLIRQQHCMHRYSVMRVDGDGHYVEVCCPDCEFEGEVPWDELTLHGRMR